MSLIFDLIYNNLSSPRGYRFRRKYLEKGLGKVGNNFTVGLRSDFSGLENIELGNNNNMMNDIKLYAHDGGKIIIGDKVSINNNAYLDASQKGRIFIGNNVLIAQNVVIRASNHRFSDLHKPINKQGHEPGEIVIKDDVWIGANAVITSGVTIESHSIVAAGAVVTKNVAEYDIVGGVPARSINNRKKSK